MNTKKNFFISYTQKDERQALWIDRILKKAGYTTIIQACDFMPGETFTGNMHRALQNSERLIAVLTDDYFESAMCNKEWENAFYKYCEDDRAIIPVRVSNVNPKGVFTSIIYIDLYKAEESEREKILINGVRGTSIKNSPDTSGIIRRREKGNLPMNNLPHVRNPYFTGRTEELDLIFNNFHNNHVSSLIQSVTGFGGVGKTSLVLEYAYSHSHKYELIWWVNADNEQSVISSYKDFALKKDIISLEANSNDIIEAVKYWFNMNEHWLFIYDNANVDDFNEWLEFYFPLNNKGNILITTRNNFFPKSKSISVSVFNEMESLLFLNKRTAKNDEGYFDDSAKILAERLQYLPLALEQASAYIVETPNVTYKDYIELMNEYGSDIFKKKRYLVDYTSTINITWNISIKRINKKSAKQLFSMCAYFAPNQIPIYLFVDGREVLPEPLKTDIHNKIKMNEILRDLTRYSLLICDDNNLLYMHRLLQEVVQKRFRKSKKWISYCFSLIYYEFIFRFDNVDINSMMEFKLNASHAIAIMEKSEKVFMEEGILLEVARMYGIIGCGFLNWREFKHALKILMKNLEIYESIYGKESYKCAVVYDNIGSAYGYLGNADESIKFHEKSLELLHNSPNKNDKDIMIAYNNIGDSYRDNENAEMSIIFFKKALSICKELFGESSIHAATLYNNIALSFRSQKKYDEAFKFINFAIEIRENSYELGKNHPQTAEAYNNIALFYCDLEQYNIALDWYLKSIPILINIFGMEHQETILTLNSIVGAFIRNGNNINDLKNWLNERLAKQIGFFIEICNA